MTDHADSRCGWARTPAMIDYHDREWGVPCHDDRLLFEHLILDGAQAGLSWSTILNRREHYRAAFARFDPAVVARFGERETAALLANPGIIRNRLKIASAIKNANAFLEIQREFGSFDAYLWRFVEGRPKVNHWRELGEIPATSPESDALSKDLRRRGFSFVGSTIIYAFMQACGMINDHLETCFRHGQCRG